MAGEWISILKMLGSGGAALYLGELLKSWRQRRKDQSDEKIQLAEIVGRREEKAIDALTKIAEGTIIQHDDLIKRLNILTTTCQDQETEIQKQQQQVAVLSQDLVDVRQQLDRAIGQRNIAISERNKWLKIAESLRVELEASNLAVADTTAKLEQANQKCAEADATIAHLNKEIARCHELLQSNGIDPKSGPAGPVV